MSEQVWEERPNEKKVRRIAKTISNIPSGYIEMKLSSCGKLSVPSKIHVKDYTIEDIFKVSEEHGNIVKNILSIMDNIIFEDINPYDLHEEDLKEILVSVYNSFWSPYIRDYNFLALANKEDLDDLEETKSKEVRYKFEKGEYELSVDINLRELKTKPILKELVEPLTLSDKEGKDVLQIRLPRIGDIIIATEFIEEKFAHEEQVFMSMDFSTANATQREAYENYQEIRTYELYKTLRALQIQGTMTDDGFKDLTDVAIETKLEAFNQVPYSAWVAFDSEIKKQKLEDFGIIDTVEIISPITNNKIIRSCLFQLMELIPTSKLQNSSRYNFRFGS